MLCPRLLIQDALRCFDLQCSTGVDLVKAARPVQEHRKIDIAFVEGMRNAVRGNPVPNQTIKRLKKRLAYTRDVTSISVKVGWMLGNIGAATITLPAREFSYNPRRMSK